MLTEDRVREIVRDELKKYLEELSVKEKEGFIWSAQILAESIQRHVADQGQCKID